MPLSYLLLHLLVEPTDKATSSWIRGLRGGGGLHLDPFGFTWIDMDSLGLTWIDLDSLGLTWIHLDSLGLIWIHLVKGKGQPPAAVFIWIPSSYPNIMRCTHTRNTTISRLRRGLPKAGLSPPNLRYV